MSINVYPIWLVTCEMESDFYPRFSSDDGEVREHIQGGVRYRVPIHAPTAADAITIGTLACDSHGRVVAGRVPTPCSNCRGSGAEKHGPGFDGRCISCRGRGYRG